MHAVAGGLRLRLPARNDHLRGRVVLLCARIRLDLELRLLWVLLPRQDLRLWLLVVLDIVLQLDLQLGLNLCLVVRLATLVLNVDNADDLLANNALSLPLLISRGSLLVAPSASRRVRVPVIYQVWLVVRCLILQRLLGLGARGGLFGVEGVLSQLASRPGALQLAGL